MPRCHTLRYLLLFLCLTAGCLLHVGTIPPDAPKDSVITQHVETQLAEDRSGDLDGIVVATDGGTVTLTGTVPKAERKARAAELARQVKCVKPVKNALDIRPDVSR